MGVYNGSNKIGKVFYGSNKIGKVYNGSNLVYQSLQPIIYTLQSLTGGKMTNDIFKIRSNSTYPGTELYSNPYEYIELDVSTYLAAGNICYIYNKFSSSAMAININGNNVTTLSGYGHYDLNIQTDAIIKYNSSSNTVSITY